MKKFTVIKLFSLLLAILFVSAAIVACDGSTDAPATEAPTDAPEIPTDAPEAPTDAPNADEPAPEEPGVPEVDEEDPEELKEAKYTEAFAMLAAEEYEAAYALFAELGDYKDAAKHLSRFRYALVKTEGRYDNDRYDEHTTFVTQHVLNDKNLVFRKVYYASNGHDYDDFYYDDHGNLIKHVSVYSDGEKIEYEYIYDLENRVIKCLYSAYGELSVTDYFFDEQGRLIEENETCEETGYKRVDRLTYDENGNLVKKFRELKSRTIEFEYVYDDRGNKIKETTTSSDGSVDICENVYDENNNLIQQKLTGPWSDAVYNYTYDENGNRIKEEYSDTYGNTSQNDYVYDENGNLIKEVWTYNGEDVTTYEYTYDEHGNQITEHYYSDDGDTRTCSSVYKLVYSPFELTGEALFYNTY